MFSSEVLTSGITSIKDHVSGQRKGGGALSKQEHKDYLHALVDGRNGAMEQRLKSVSYRGFLVSRDSLPVWDWKLCLYHPDQFSKEIAAHQDSEG